MHELQTVYDSEDLYLLLEITSVRNWNSAQAAAEAQRRVAGDTRAF
ncbi:MULTISPECIES: hypothetical protein [Acetobacter]|nr:MULTISPECIES: hypothetical protein [Acetobacter]MBS0961131.1 hypothetical protein [Acetobacter thailandicus]MBS1003875.1 hypothetical protein [Acetobacter thailandicus]